MKSAFVVCLLSVDEKVGGEKSSLWSQGAMDEKSVVTPYTPINVDSYDQFLSS